MISAASAQRSDRPVVVLYHGSRTASSSGRSRRARTISSRCRSRPASSASRSRRRSEPRGCVSQRIDDHRARAEGRTGKTVTSSSRSLALEDRTSVLSTSTCSATGWRSGSSRRRRSTTSPPRAARSTATRSTASSPSTSGAELFGAAFGSGGGDRYRLPARSSRSSARGTTSSSSTRPGLHARGDRRGGRLLASAWSGCWTRFAEGHEDRLETLAEMGYDPRAITLAQPRRLERGHHSAGRGAGARPRAGRPRRQRPGDPRALTNGQPITVADPKSKAARSYATLAERYLAARHVPVAASNDNGRRRLLLRKAS